MKEIFKLVRLINILFKIFISENYDLKVWMICEKKVNKDLENLHILST